MNERQRMQYLEVMGIDTFVPRFLLSGAKVSGVCELPVITESITPEPNKALASLGFTKGVVSNVDASLQPAIETGNAGARSESSGLERVSIAGIISSKAEQVQEKREEGQSKADNNKTDKPALDLKSLISVQVPKEQVRFSLALWHVGNLQAIDSRKQGDALPTDALLTNILRSFDCLESHLPKVEILHWPMVETAQENGWGAAKEMVHGFLDGRLMAKPVSHILLFGQDAYQSVLGEASGVEADDTSFLKAQYTAVHVEAFDATAIILPSLADILRQPSSKLDVWHSLIILSRK